MKSSGICVGLRREELSDSGGSVEAPHICILPPLKDRFPIFLGAIYASVLKKLITER